MLYLIGKIVSTHGIKGEVKVQSITDFNRFFVGSKVIINQQEMTIKTVRRQQDLYLISFENFPTLSEVEHLKKQEIYTSQEPDELLEDEFHLPQLIGLDVYAQNNYFVGKVIELVEVPQGYLLRVKKDDGQYKLIPFVDVFIKEVTDEKIVIDAIEGLI
ncbi:ribosome maturation factor RimM [Acholeplasma granularum]|uniref:ribosome maturation factor RimM n=1 Tax=Acholeplasma granularum TaxID=264635 RepID=UPI0004B401D4|nr:ribosome maturation factor RimM [Acholeplasma granularum]